MQFFIWFLCLVVGGCEAFFCKETECDDSFLGDLVHLEYKPNKAELLHLCPQALNFFKCYFRGVRVCLGMTVEDIVSFGDEISSTIANSLLNAETLAVAICDENSTLHKDYIENVDCFERLVDDDTDVAYICTQKGGKYAEAFLKQRHNQEDLDYDELDCLERVYQLACFVEQLEMTCGEVARQTFLAILEKLKTSVLTECDIEDPLSLKRSFLEYLDLYDRRSDLYWSIFKSY